MGCGCSRCARRAAERHDFAALLYQRVWRPSNVDAATGGSVQGEWLILADRGGVGAQLSALLEANGDTCTLRFADATPELPAPDRPLKGVIHLWSLDLAPADIAARRRASASVLPWSGRLRHARRRPGRRVCGW